MPGPVEDFVNSQATGKEGKSQERVEEIGVLERRKREGKLGGEMNIIQYNIIRYLRHVLAIQYNVEQATI